jgi:hypothetical protein
MKIVDDFLNFVAEVATVSHQEAIDGMREGDQGKFDRNRERTDLLSAVANIDGTDRWTKARNRGRKK